MVAAKAIQKMPPCEKDTEAKKHCVFVRLFLLEQRNDPEEDDGTDNGGDDLSDDGGAPVDAKPPEDIASDKAADDTDEQIDPKAETGTFHDFACQESCQRSDKDGDNNTHNLNVLLVNNYIIETKVQNYTFFLIVEEKNECPLVSPSRTHHTVINSSPNVCKACLISKRRRSLGVFIP